MWYIKLCIFLLSLDVMVELILKWSLVTVQGANGLPVWADSPYQFVPTTIVIFVLIMVKIIDAVRKDVH